MTGRQCTWSAYRRRHRDVQNLVGIILLKPLSLVKQDAKFK